MRCTVSHIYLVKNSACFGQIYCPSLGVPQDQPINTPPSTQLNQFHPDLANRWQHN